MRRKDREVSYKKDILEIMNACDVCRLALNDDGYPYIVPVNFGMEFKDDVFNLYFHGAIKGKKVDLIRADGRVGFEMDGSHKLVLKEEACNCTMGYASVIGRGKIEILPDDEKIHGLDMIMQHYHPGNYSYRETEISQTAVFKLTVEHISAKINKR